VVGGSASRVGTARVTASTGVALVVRSGSGVRSVRGNGVAVVVRSGAGVAAAGTAVVITGRRGVGLGRGLSTTGQRLGVPDSVTVTVSASGGSTVVTGVLRGHSGRSSGAEVPRRVRGIR
jgi:hypothetical protein